MRVSHYLTRCPAYSLSLTVTRVCAVPVRPALPVLPTRCVLLSMSLANEKRVLRVLTNQRRVFSPGHVKVDHVPDVGDVQTSGRHVGGHQHGELLLLERADDVITLSLTNEMRVLGVLTNESQVLRHHEDNEGQVR